MAVSVGQLACDLRLHTDPDNPPAEPLAGVLTRLLDTATQMVAERVRDDTPDSLRDAAIIAIASFLFDKPSAAPAGRYSNAWQYSGAGSILSQWVRLQAVAIEG